MLRKMFIKHSFERGEVDRLVGWANIKQEKLMVNQITFAHLRKETLPTLINLDTLVG